MNFKRLGLLVSLVLISFLGLLGYTNIVAVSQGGTGATTASGARTGLGVAIGTNVQAYDADLTTWAGLTPSAFFQTLVDDASAAAARDTLVHASAGSIACSSPCTPAAGITTVTVAGTTTVNLPALSTYADGQRLLIVCDSASTCPVTLDPSDSGTCDSGSAGAACSSITVLAHGVVGAVRTSSSTWGSVQPGTAVVGRIVIDCAAGSLRHYGQAYLGGAWTTVTAVSTTFTTADPGSLGAACSGSNIAWSAGTAVCSGCDVDAEGQVIKVALSAYTLDTSVPGRQWEMQMVTGGTTVTGGGGSDYSIASVALFQGATVARGVGYRQGTAGSPAGIMYQNTSPSIDGAVAGIRRVSIPVPVPFINDGDVTAHQYDVNGAFLSEQVQTATLGVTSGLPDFFGFIFYTTTADRATTVTAPVAYLYVN